MEVRTQFIELGPGDRRAKEHILESLSVCATDHILSRKLLDRFSMATGSFFAIVGDWYPLEQMVSYDYIIPGPEGEVASGERPTERLITFVAGYLSMTKDAVVLCEHWAAKRQHLAKWHWLPPRVLCYGESDVYHVVTPEITNSDMIESAIEPRGHWQTGICTTCSHIPNSDDVDEAYLDDIVGNTRHIFVPAFDRSGYLIWSPARV